MAFVQDSPQDVDDVKTVHSHVAVEIPEKAVAGCRLLAQILVGSSPDCKVVGQKMLRNHMYEVAQVAIDLAQDEAKTRLASTILVGQDTKSIMSQMKKADGKKKTQAKTIEMENSNPNFCRALVTSLSDVPGWYVISFFKNVSKDALDGQQVSKLFDKGTAEGNKVLSYLSGLPRTMLLSDEFMDKQIFHQFLVFMCTERGDLMNSKNGINFFKGQVNDGVVSFTGDHGEYSLIPKDDDNTKAVAVRWNFETRPVAEFDAGDEVLMSKVVHDNYNRFTACVKILGARRSLYKMFQANVKNLNKKKVEAALPGFVESWLRQTKSDKMKATLRVDAMSLTQANRKRKGAPTSKF